MTHTPTVVPPLQIQEVSRGYAIVVTLIDNLNGSRVHACGWLVWPETEDGKFSRDRFYDSLPTEPKRPKRRIEVSIDRVGPGSLDIVETRRIPRTVGEALLGQTLPQALAWSAASPVAQPLPVSRFEEALTTRP